MRFSVRSVFFLSVLLAVAASLLSMRPAHADELGTDWVPRYPFPLNNDMLDLAVNTAGNNLVAVGAHGTIISTNDLSAWNKAATGVSDDFLGVVYGGGTYYAVGNKGNILSSSNSTTWNVKYSASTDIFQCVAWNGSRVVAAGAYAIGSSFGAVIVTSSDGTNWTRRTFPNMLPITRIAWNGQVLVGIMNGATATSLDGSAWSIHALPLAAGTGTAGTRSIVWTGTQYLVSGDSIWRSVDGVVWTEYTALLGAVQGLYLSWTGSELLVCSSSQVLSSTDQVGFTNRSSGLPSSETYGVRFGGSIVMAGLGGHIDSQDSTGTWVQRRSPGLPTSVLGMANSSSLYVAVGAGITWTSPDGNTWTEHVMSDKNFRSIAWSGTQFVAAGTGIWTSPDGVTWTVAVAADTNAQQLWTLVTWIQGKGYASGYDYANNVVLSKISITGTTWNAGTMTGVILGMARSTADGRILAVGFGGTALYSTDDGATWSGGSVPLGGSQDFNDVAFGNGKFVAVTSAGAIWSSTDGLGWDRSNLGSGFLNGITRTTTEFVTVGNNGKVLRSFDGQYWRLADSRTSTSFNRVNYISGTGRLIAMGASANIITSDGTLPVRTTVQFATATSSMTESGSVGVVVTLSQPSTGKTTVTLNYTGTATSADFGGPGSTVQIPAGETSAFMVFTATDNNSISAGGDKTLIITLASPTGDTVLATPASAITHTITIHDNDVAPSFDVDPVDQFVTLGGAVAFTCHATGSGTLTYQWKKNGVAIPNAKLDSYTIGKAVATDAAAYTVTVTGNVGSATSDPGKLGVVTVQNLVQQVKANVAATFTANVKVPTGAVLSYQWKRGAQDLSIDSHITDATAKLTIPSVVVGDTGIYTCNVTLGSGPGAPTVTATTVDYTVLGAVPVITQADPLSTRVAATIDFTPVAAGKPTKWTAAPLPPGVIVNAATGRLTGKFTKAGTYNVKFTATNLIGPGTMTYAITVDPLSATNLGTFMALMDRDTDVNAGLGGRLDLITTASGTFSGKLTLPVTALPFTGVLSGARGTNPGVVNLPIPKTSLLLSFTINDGTGIVTATVNNGLKILNGTGMQQAVAGSPSRAGGYTFALAPDAGSPVGTPQGDGYGKFTLAATGALTVAGKLADGTAYSVITFTAANGDIPLYAPVLAGKGSLHGVIKLNEDSGSNYANNSISGSPSWKKNEDLTSRSYKTGIPLMTLNADGGRFNVSATTVIVMELPTGVGNATLTLTGGGLDLASRHPSNAFTVVKPAKATLTTTNTAATTLVFGTSTTAGLISGQFVLSDTAFGKVIPRTVLYSGVQIRPGGSIVMVGRGFFNMAQLPTSASEAATTTPMLSGLVQLDRTPVAP